MSNRFLGKSDDREDEKLNLVGRKSTDGKPTRHRSSKPPSEIVRRSTEGDRGFHPASTSYSSSTLNPFPDTTPAPIASNNFMASRDEEEGYLPPEFPATKPQRENRIDGDGRRRTNGRNGGQEVDWEDEQEGESIARTSSKGQYRHSKTKSEGKDRGLGRAWTDDIGETTRAYKKASGSFSAHVGSPGFVQFPGQYDGPSGYMDGPAVPTTRISDHVPDQFPGQFPINSTAPYRPPLGKSEGGLGLAAEYYGDAGQSVAEQPGVRPHRPAVIIGAEPHLQTPSAVAAPPPEPSASGGIGAAASFFAGSFNGGAEGQGTYSHVTTGNLNAPVYQQQASGKPSQGTQNSTSSKPGKYYQSSSAPAIPTLSAAAVGAAAGSFIGSQASSHQQRPDYVTSSGGIGEGRISTDHNSQSQSQHYPDSIPYSSRPTKPPKHSSYPSIPVAAVAGAVGLAAASGHQDNHQWSQISPSGQQQVTAIVHEHRHHNRLNKLVDFFRDPDGVGRFEEYTEAIGVCKGCFEPGSSPRDAPRKHYHHRLGSQERYGSSARIDKDRRYSSSSNEGLHRSKKSWIEKRIAGFTLAKVGESLFNQPSGSDGSDRSKPGHNHSSHGSRRHNNSSSPNRNGPSSPNVSRHSAKVLPVRHRHSKDGFTLTASRTSTLSSHRDGRSGRNHRSSSTSYHSRHRSKSRSKSCSPSSHSGSKYRRNGVVEAAAGAVIGGSIIAASSRHHSRSPKQKPVDSHSVTATSKQEGLECGDRSQHRTDGGGRHSPSGRHRRIGRVSRSKSSSSSSSVDSDSGRPKIAPRRSSGPQVRAQENHNTEAISLGATAENLVLQERRKGDKSKQKYSHSPSKQSVHSNSITHLHNQQNWKKPVSSDSDEGLWVDASEDDSIHLAYGSSRESLSSDSSGLGKWGWRWGWGKNRKHNEGTKNGRHIDRNKPSIEVTPTFMAEPPVEQSPAVDHQSHTQETNLISGTLNYVHPIPTEDPSLFDVEGQSAILSLNQPNNFFPPVEHPQPISPVPAAVYNSHPSHNYSFSAPHRAPIISPDFYQKHTLSPTQRSQNQVTFPESKIPGSFPLLDQSGSAGIDAATPVELQMGTVPAIHGSELGSVVSPPLQRTLPLDDSTVRFALIEEHKKDKREIRLQGTEEGKNRGKFQREEDERSRETAQRKEEDRKRRAIRQQEELDKYRARRQQQEEEAKSLSRSLQEDEDIKLERIRWEQEDEKCREKRRQRQDEDDRFDRLEEERRKKSIKAREASKGASKNFGTNASEGSSELENEKTAEPIFVEIVPKSRQIESQTEASPVGSISTEQKIASYKALPKELAEIRRKESAIEEQSVSVWKDVAKRRSSSYEDYADFFIPAELLSRSNDQRKDTDPNADCNLIETITESKISHDTSHSPAYATTPTGDEPSMRLPWVPQLRLISPTPVISRAPTPTLDRSGPTNSPVPKNQQAAATRPEAKKIRNTTPNPKFNWGEEEILVYTQITPMDDRDQLIDSPPNERSVDVDTKGRKKSSPMSESTGNDNSSYHDDLEFAAHLAAGLEATGFDSSVVIDDPTFRQRTSPPGSERAGTYSSSSHAVPATMPGAFGEDEAEHTDTQDETTQKDKGVGRKNSTHKIAKKGKDPDIVETISADLVSQPSMSKPTGSDRDLDSLSSQFQEIKGNRKSNRNVYPRDDDLVRSSREDTQEDEFYDAAGSYRSQRYRADAESTISEPLPRMHRKSEAYTPKRSQPGSDLYESPPEDDVSVAATAPVSTEKDGGKKSRKKSRRKSSAAVNVVDPDSSANGKKDKKEGLISAIFGRSTKASSGLPGLKEVSITEIADDFSESRRSGKSEEPTSSRAESRRGEGATSGKSEALSTSRNPEVEDYETRSHKSQGRKEKRRSTSEKTTKDSGRITQDLPAKDQDTDLTKETRGEKLGHVPIEPGNERQIDGSGLLSFLGARPRIPPLPDSPEPSNLSKSGEHQSVEDIPSSIKDSAVVGVEQDPLASRVNSGPNFSPTVNSPPTAVPFAYRRNPPLLSKGFGFRSPIPSRTKTRPCSTEFKSSEFRPLYLVARHTPRQEPSIENYYSLPSSHSNSRTSSTQDPDEYDLERSPNQIDALDLVDQIMNPHIEGRGLVIDSQHSLQGLDPLDSAQSTPTAHSFQADRQRDATPQAKTMQDLEPALVNMPLLQSPSFTNFMDDPSSTSQHHSQELVRDRTDFSSDHDWKNNLPEKPFNLTEDLPLIPSSLASSPYSVSEPNSLETIIQPIIHSKHEFELPDDLPPLPSSRPSSPDLDDKLDEPNKNPKPSLRPAENGLERMRDFSFLSSSRPLPPDPCIKHAEQRFLFPSKHDFDIQEDLPSLPSSRASSLELRDRFEKTTSEPRSTHDVRIPGDLPPLPRSRTPTPDLDAQLGRSISLPELSRGFESPLNLPALPSSRALSPDIDIKSAPEPKTVTRPAYSIQAPEDLQTLPSSRASPPGLDARVRNCMSIHQPVHEFEQFEDLPPLPSSPASSPDFDTDFDFVPIISTQSIFEFQRPEHHPALPSGRASSPDADVFHDVETKIRLEPTLEFLRSQDLPALPSSRASSPGADIFHDIETEIPLETTFELHGSEYLPAVPVSCASCLEAYSTHDIKTKRPLEPTLEFQGSEDHSRLPSSRASSPDSDIYHDVEKKRPIQPTNLIQIFEALPALPPSRASSPNSSNEAEEINNKSGLKVMPQEKIISNPGGGLGSDEVTSAINAEIAESSEAPIEKTLQSPDLLTSKENSLDDEKETEPSIQRQPDVENADPISTPENGIGIEPTLRHQESLSSGTLTKEMTGDEVIAVMAAVAEGGANTHKNRPPTNSKKARKNRKKTKQEDRLEASIKEASDRVPVRQQKVMEDELNLQSFASKGPNIPSGENLADATELSIPILRTEHSRGEILQIEENAPLVKNGKKGKKNKKQVVQTGPSPKSVATDDFSTKAGPQTAHAAVLIPTAGDFDMEEAQLGGSFVEIVDQKSPKAASQPETPPEAFALPIDDDLELLEALSQNPAVRPIDRTSLPDSFSETTALLIDGHQKTVLESMKLPIAKLPKDVCEIQSYPETIALPVDDDLDLLEALPSSPPMDSQLEIIEEPNLRSPTEILGPKITTDILVLPAAKDFRSLSAPPTSSFAGPMPTIPEDVLEQEIAPESFTLPSDDYLDLFEELPASPLADPMDSQLEAFEELKFYSSRELNEPEVAPHLIPDKELDLPDALRPPSASDKRMEYQPERHEELRSLSLKELSEPEVAPQAVELPYDDDLDLLEALPPSLPTSPTPELESLVGLPPSPSTGSRENHVELQTRSLEEPIPEMLELAPSNVAFADGDLGLPEARPKLLSIDQRSQQTYLLDKRISKWQNELVAESQLPPESIQLPADEDRDLLEALPPSPTKSTNSDGVEQRPLEQASQPEEASSHALEPLKAIDSQVLPKYLQLSANDGLDLLEALPESPLPESQVVTKDFPLPTDDDLHLEKLPENPLYKSRVVPENLLLPTDYDLDFLEALPGKSIGDAVSEVLVRDNIKELASEEPDILDNDNNFSNKGKKKIKGNKNQDESSESVLILEEVEPPKASVVTLPLEGSNERTELSENLLRNAEIGDSQGQGMIEYDWLKEPNKKGKNGKKAKDNSPLVGSTETTKPPSSETMKRDPEFEDSQAQAVTEDEWLKKPKKNGKKGKKSKGKKSKPSATTPILPPMTSPANPIDYSSSTEVAAQVKALELSLDHPADTKDEISSEDKIDEVEMKQISSFEDNGTSKLQPGQTESEEIVSEVALQGPQVEDELPGSNKKKARKDKKWKSKLTDTYREESDSEKVEPSHVLSKPRSELVDQLVETGGKEAVEEPGQDQDLTETMGLELEQIEPRQEIPEEALPDATIDDEPAEPVRSGNRSKKGIKSKRGSEVDATTLADVTRNQLELTQPMSELESKLPIPEDVRPKEDDAATLEKQDDEPVPLEEDPIVPIKRSKKGKKDSKARKKADDDLAQPEEDPITLEDPSAILEKQNNEPEDDVITPEDPSAVLDKQNNGPEDDVITPEGFPDVPEKQEELGEPTAPLKKAKRSKKGHKVRTREVNKIDQPEDSSAVPDEFQKREDAITPEDLPVVSEQHEDGLQPKEDPITQDDLFAAPEKREDEHKTEEDTITPNDFSAVPAIQRDRPEKTPVATDPITLEDLSSAVPENQVDGPEQLEDDPIAPNYNPAVEKTKKGKKGKKQYFFDELDQPEGVLFTSADRSVAPEKQEAESDKLGKKTKNGRKGKPKRQRLDDRPEEDPVTLEDTSAIRLKQTGQLVQPEEDPVTSKDLSAIHTKQIDTLNQTGDPIISEDLPTLIVDRLDRTQEGPITSEELSALAIGKLDQSEQEPILSEGIITIATTEKGKIGNKPKKGDSRGLEEHEEQSIASEYSAAVIEAIQPEDPTAIEKNDAGPIQPEAEEFDRVDEEPVAVKSRAVPERKKSKKGKKTRQEGIDLAEHEPVASEDTFPPLDDDELDQLGQENVASADIVAAPKAKKSKKGKKEKHVDRLGPSDQNIFIPEDASASQDELLDHLLDRPDQSTIASDEISAPQEQSAEIPLKKKSKKGKKPKHYENFDRSDEGPITPEETIASLKSIPDGPTSKEVGQDDKSIWTSLVPVASRDTYSSQEDISATTENDRNKNGRSELPPDDSRDVALEKTSQQLWENIVKPQAEPQHEVTNEAEAGQRSSDMNPDITGPIKESRKTETLVAEDSQTDNSLDVSASVQAEEATLQDHFVKPQAEREFEDAGIRSTPEWKLKPAKNSKREKKSKKETSDSNSLNTGEVLERGSADISDGATIAGDMNLKLTEELQEDLPEIRLTEADIEKSNPVEELSVPEWGLKPARKSKKEKKSKKALDSDSRRTREILEGGPVDVSEETALARDMDSNPTEGLTELEQNLSELPLTDPDVAEELAIPKAGLKSAKKSKNEKSKKTAFDTDSLTIPIDDSTRPESGFIPSKESKKDNKSKDRAIASSSLVPEASETPTETTKEQIFPEISKPDESISIEDSTMPKPRPQPSESKKNTESKNKPIVNNSLVSEVTPEPTASETSTGIPEDYVISKLSSAKKSKKSRKAGKQNLEIDYGQSLAIGAETSLDILAEPTIPEHGPSTNRKNSKQSKKQDFEIDSIVPPLDTEPLPQNSQQAAEASRRAGSADHEDKEDSRSIDPTQHGTERHRTLTPEQEIILDAREQIHDSPPVDTRDEIGADDTNVKMAGFTPEAPTPEESTLAESIKRDGVVPLSGSPHITGILPVQHDIQDSGFQGTEARALGEQYSELVQEESQPHFEDERHSSGREIEAQELDLKRTDSATQNTFNTSVEDDQSYEVSISTSSSKRKRSLTISTPVRNDEEVFPNSTRGVESLQTEEQSFQDPVEPSPLSPTTKERSSALFQPSPSTREDFTNQRPEPEIPLQDPAEIKDVEYGSRVMPDWTQPEDFSISKSRTTVPTQIDLKTSNMHEKRGPSDSESPVSPVSPVGFREERTPSRSPFVSDISDRSRLNTIVEYSPEESPLHKKSRSVSDVGSPEGGVKSRRRSAVPQQTSQARMRSPLNPENTARLMAPFEDLSWPPVDEDNHTVDLERSGSRNTSISAASRLAKQSERRSLSGASVGSVESINAIIKAPEVKRSGTPPLRRTDRSVSGDLREAHEKGGANKKLAKPKEAERQLDISISSSSTYDPTKDNGKSRVDNMAAVYEGWGDVRMASPISPTRPPSMRRRQSLLVLDLENKIDRLVSENRLLMDAKLTADTKSRSLEMIENDRSQLHQKLSAAERARDEYLARKDGELNELKRIIEGLHGEVSHLTEANGELTASRGELVQQHQQRFSQLETERDHILQQWEQSVQELQELRQKHTQLSKGIEQVVQREVSGAIEAKNVELHKLRDELEAAKEQVRVLQQQILASKSTEDPIIERDEDYFDSQCQQLCGHVQQWVLRFSKFSDSRACYLASEIMEEKIVDRFENAILDGSDVDLYLKDRVMRRDVFMSVVMAMVWEFVFTRYLFGMDREQRSKLKLLEKTLTEVGPVTAVNKWRATTLTLLSKRESFAAQRATDTEAILAEIFSTLATFLPPPQHLVKQIKDSLRKVISAAVDLSIEMRTQRAQYMMLPPLQPEYDTHGELVRKVHFNAGIMNERSGTTISNEALEAQRAVVRLVLFPLVVKKGDDDGVGVDEVVICPAQVLTASSLKDKKVVRIVSGATGGGEASGSRSRLGSVVTGAGGSDVGMGGMV